MVLWSWWLPLPGALQKFSKESCDLISSELYPHSFPCFPMCLRRKAPKSVLCGSEWLICFIWRIVGRHDHVLSLHWSEHPLLLTGHQGDCCSFAINLHISHHASTPFWFYLLLKNNRLNLSSSLPLAISLLHPPLLSPVPLCSIYVSYLKPLVSIGFWVIPFNVPEFFWGRLGSALTAYKYLST